MLKKKILYLTLVLTGIFLSLYGVALSYSYKSLQNLDPFIRIGVSSQFLSIGIYVTGLIISFLSIFASIGAISSEVEKGNYDAILSKPIARHEIVFGRFVGILLVLLPYVTFLYSSVVGFNMLFGKGIIPNFSTLNIFKSIAVLWLLPILLSSIGIFLSCSLSTMAAGVTLAILYFLGIVGGVLEQIGNIITGEAQAILTNIGIITSLAMPSDIVYRKASSLLNTTSAGMNVSLNNMVGASIQPSLLMIIYIVFYIIVMIALAIRRFQTRDL